MTSDLRLAAVEFEVGDMRETIKEIRNDLRELNRAVKKNSQQHSDYQQAVELNRDKQREKNDG